jgi:hypothetical protein
MSKGTWGARITAPAAQSLATGLAGGCGQRILPSVAAQFIIPAVIPIPLNAHIHILAHAACAVLCSKLGLGSRKPFGSIVGVQQQNDSDQLPNRSPRRAYYIAPLDARQKVS